MAIALVTGASAGLGVEFATLLAERGYDVVVTARDLKRLEALATILRSKFRVNVYPIGSDLSEPGSAKRLFDICKKRGLTVDVLINNAGSGTQGPFVHGSMDNCGRMLHLNMVSLTELTWAFGRSMLERKYGHILNVASTAAFLPGPFMAGYYASKAYVLSLSEALSFEFRGTGVHVSALCPGPTRTEFFQRAGIELKGLKARIAASPTVCAKRGIEGLFEGRPVIVDGWKNQILVFILRLTPRRVARSVSAMLVLGAAST